MRSRFIRRLTFHSTVVIKSEASVTPPVDKPRLESWWYKWSVINGFLTPLLVAWLAFYFNAEIDRRGTLAAEVQAEADRVAADDRAVIDRAAIIPAVILHLTEGTPAQEELAMEAITILLPDKAPFLQEIIARNKALPIERRAEAERGLDTQVASLIAAMFDPDDEAMSIRVEARDRLIRGGFDPARVVPPLLAYATGNLDNGNGVANTLRYFRSLSDEALQPFASGVGTLARSALHLDGDLPRLAQNVIDRLDQLPVFDLG